MKQNGLAYFVIFRPAIFKILFGIVQKVLNWKNENKTKIKKTWKVETHFDWILPFFLKLFFGCLEEFLDCECMNRKGRERNIILLVCCFFDLSKFGSSPASTWGLLNKSRQFNVKIYYPIIVNAVIFLRKSSSPKINKTNSNSIYD